MDQIFAHVSDLIALSGPSGVSLSTAVQTVVPDARPGLIAFLHRQFSEQPHFTITRANDAQPDDSDATIIAHENLRRRALGFSPIEHPPLPQPAWTLLEAIGAAGPSGILQAKMGPLVGLQPNMVHHYIGLLSARRLIGRRKTIIQKSSEDVVVSTTYTSVIVLARYAAQMLDPHSPTSPADVASDIRLQRVLQVLRQPPHIRAERDLKIIAIPDSDKSDTMTHEIFQRRRHRNYRSLRTKLIRLGVAQLVKRKCITQSGRVIGQHPCLKLLESAKQFGTKEKEERRVSHPLLAGGVDNFVAEVDVVEQVYRMLVEAGPAGISVPELGEYLDSKGLTAAPAKRIKSIITAISKIHPTVERQYFEGSAMYLRISLKSEEDARNEKEGSEKRRKVGVTTLGENRQEIVMKLLEQRKVLVLESLGREVARVEDGAVQKIDPKVMRRLISDLVTQKRVKLITTARPTIKDNPRSQTLVLVALPDVDERGEDVKKVVTSVVHRSLYGSQDETRQQDARTPEKARKRTKLDDEEEKIKASNKREKRSGKNGAQKESEGEEEPVIMYQADDSGDEMEDTNVVGDERHAKVGDGNENKRDPKKPRRITGSNDQRTSRPADTNGVQDSESVQHQEKEATSNAELPGESLHNVGNAKRPEKRKSVEEEGKSPQRRRTKKKPSKPSVGQDKKKMSEKDKVDSKAGKQQADSSAIVIKALTRDLELSRIGRLRATDYGCLKGKLARIRRFHKNLYQIMRARNGDVTEASVSAHHIAVASARATPAIGNFSFLSMVKDMMVGEYAATVGIYGDHGDAIKKIEKEKIENVLDEMGDEITSTTASRQVQQFVQTLTKLELIQSDVDSQWVLAGAGIIRDFGRGLPSGIVPHGILFSSSTAVEEFWLELEQFSRCKLSRKPITIDLRNEETTNQVETHPIGDLYFPKRWETGTHCLQKGEQLSYETILQRMSGVEVVFEEKARLRPNNFIKGKLKRFDVEELIKAMEDVLKDSAKKESMSLPTKKGLCTEQLLLYSRFRSTNPLPKWFIKNIEASKTTPRVHADGEKKPTGNNSCLLQLTRTPSSVKGYRVRATMPSVFDTNHRRYFKTRAKPKPTKKATPEGRVDLGRMIPLVKAILRGRAIAYGTNDVEGLDWKTIPSLARYELQLSAADLKEAVDQENLRRVIVGLCEIATVRAALDILSLKLVLKMREIVARRTIDEDGEPWSSEHVETLAVDLINGWDLLDTVCSAVIIEVRDDVRHHTKVCINVDACLNLYDTASRRNILKSEFRIAEFLHGRPESFEHEIELMASRFRKIADVRLFREVRYAVLLSRPYGESIGEEGLARKGKNESEDNGPTRANDALQPENERNKMIGASTKPDRASTEGQEPDQVSREDETAPLNATRRSALSIRGEDSTGTKQNKKTGTSETLTDTITDTVRPVESIRQTTRASLFRAEENPLYRYAQCTAPHSLPELAELAVCTVVRQPPHAQWKADCLKLLCKFREEDLADARDRLILRGSISVHANRESTRSCLQPCKNSQPTEVMSVFRGDKGNRRKWGEELSNRGDGCVENTKLWSDVCDLEGASSFATAFATSSVFFANPELQLIPEFEEDDEATCHDEEKEDEDEEEDGAVSRVKLYFHIDQDRGPSAERRKRRSSRRANSSQEVDERLGAEYRQRVAHAISATGRQGMWLDSLLQQLNPHFEEERVAVSRALEGLLGSGEIRRFAVETDEEEWGLTTGILYIDATQAMDISAWRTPTGKVDEGLIRRVRDDIMEFVVRLPGCKYAELINSVCARHTSVPRRGVADVAFSLDGELLTIRTAIWRRGWRLLQSNACFVDENAITVWGRRSTQSVSGTAAEFHRIETCHWRNRLSQLL